MIGDFSFKLTTKKLDYEFKVNRKIMRIVGDSAKGKFELIRELSNSKNPKSGVFVNCKYDCEIINIVFTNSVKTHINNISQKFKNHNSIDFINAMRVYLMEYDNILFFADENFEYMDTIEFALFCKYTDSFFVLIGRNPLCKLPYSYTEIYTVKTSGKFHTLIPVFNQDEFLTFDENRKLIVEDSNAGFEFFEHFYKDVVSAEGKSKIGELIREYGIDGAAFGCEIEKIMFDISRKRLDIKLFLPECFEYLLLISQTC